MSKQGVGGKITWGALWSIGLNVATRGLGLISILILSRLITPYDLGVYAAAAVIIELIYVLTEVGIYPVLIHRKNPDAAFYQTAWTIQVIRAIIIFIAVELLARYLIHIYTEDENIRVAIQVIAIAALLNGFSSIYLVNFQKNIDFKGLFKFDLTCRVIGFISTIIAAYILQTYWALIAGNIILASTRLILSHIYASGPHRITFSSSSELLNVSRWMLLHEIGSFISLKSDTFLITRFLGPKILGIYEVGYQVAMAPTQEIALPVSRALFPGLAKLQDNNDQFVHIFTHTLASIIYIALPAGIGLIMVANSLVTSLFPENWHSATQVVQILAIFGIFRALFGPCVSALMGSGYMKINAKLTLLNMFLRVSALSYGLLYYGFEGLLTAAAIIAMIQAAIYLTVLVRLNLLMISDLVKMSWRAVVASSLMAYTLDVLFGSSGLLLLPSNLAVLLTSVVTGFLVYFSGIILLWLVSGKPLGVENYLRRNLSK